MSKSYSMRIIFVSLIFSMSSLIIPLNFSFALTEAQEQQSGITLTKNVTDLTKTNNKNSHFKLANKTVNYFDDSSGYLVYPEISLISSIENNKSSTINNNTLPAVVMIHENKGLNDNIKNMANLLAKEGYVVLAVDLFNGEITTNQSRASELTQIIRGNPNTAIENLKSAVSYLISLPNVNPDKIASLGWCFGGQQSLQLALNSDEEHPLAATVIYYGRLVTEPSTLSNIHWPVLGIFGDQDKSISVDLVKKFEDALNVNGIPNEIYIYKGVGHAFANPSGNRYAPQETQDAWEKTISFLNKYTS